MLQELGTGNDMILNAFTKSAFMTQVRRSGGRKFNHAPSRSRQASGGSCKKFMLLVASTLLIH